MTPSRTFPAEWAHQSGVMLTWPHHASDWSTVLDEVEPSFIRIAFEISQREKLLVVAYDQAHQQHIASLLRQHKLQVDRITLAIQPGNDTWARDHGPITVLEQGEPLLLDFIFNGWGQKYPAELDNAINQGLGKQAIFKTRMRSSPYVLEGGSIDTDGAGTLLTTRACLMTTTRNPQLDQQQLETLLKTELGVDRILWLEHGYLAGDDTDSHIDMLARFCNPDTIAYMQCENEADEHYAPLRAMQQELLAMHTPQGQPYELIGLPLPAAISNAAGQRLPASYANFLIINGAVLVPQYDDPADAIVLERLAPCFPNRTLIGIPCRALIQQYGSLHCLTMQFPDGVL